MHRDPVSVLKKKNDCDNFLSGSRLCILNVRTLTSGANLVCCCSDSIKYHA